MQQYQIVGLCLPTITAKDSAQSKPGAVMKRMALILLITFIPTGSALSQRPGAFDSGTLLNLFSWAARLTDRHHLENVPLPPSRALSARQINERICPENPDVCGRYAAFYAVQTREIIYRNTLDKRHLLDRAYLVHEFVHYLQHLEQGTAVNLTCQTILKNEKQAYFAQAIYRRRHGNSQAMNILGKLGTCPPVDSETNTPIQAQLPSAIISRPQTYSN